MAQHTPFQGWIASLNNGETVHEWEPGPGERSAWKKLIARCAIENIRITQMRLQRAGVTLVTVSNAEDYIQVKQARTSQVSGPAAELWGIGVMTGNAAVVMWIDDNRTVYHDIYPIDQMIMHSTMRDQPKHV